MKKFMLLYNGAATPQDQMSDEASKAIMAKWAEWMEKVGSAMVDMGAPLANGTTIVDDGSDGAATVLSGYSIIEAADMDAARVLVEGHPFLAEGKGNFSVEVHEMLPVPKM